MSSRVFVSARARRGANRPFLHERSREVEITRHVILDHIHMRQVDAARALVRIPQQYTTPDLPCLLCCQGISLTSLKTACRRLGFSRWPYSRHRTPDTTLQHVQEHEHGDTTDERVQQEAKWESESEGEEYLLNLEDQSDQSGWDIDIEAFDEEDQVRIEGFSEIEGSWLEWYLRSTDEDDVSRMWKELAQ